MKGTMPNFDKMQREIEHLRSIEIYLAKIEELETTAEKVCWLLSRNEHLRNCDKCLIKAYEQQVDNYDGTLNYDKKLIYPTQKIFEGRLKELVFVVKLYNDFIKDKYSTVDKIEHETSIQEEIK